MADAMRTVALFLIAAGLFATAFVIHDAMGKHGRYTPVTCDDEEVVVMDTHTGYVWSVRYEAREATRMTIFNPIAGELPIFPKRMIAKGFE